MRNEYNSKETTYINSPMEIEYALEKFQNEVYPEMTEEEYIELYYKIFYFYDFGDELKLSPDFNDNLFEEKAEQKNLMTVPVEINKYSEFLKGKHFIPFCRFNRRDKNKAHDNEIIVSIDVESKSVLANITITKYKYYLKDRNKVLNSSCYSVANYCIPALDTLIRGTANEIASNQNLAPFKINFTEYDSSKIEKLISQAVMHLGRMDIDVEHKNNFEPNGQQLFSPQEMKLLKRYYSPIACPPHFHFVRKDYVVALKEHDSSALAINVDNLTDYLVDLNLTGKSSNKDIVCYDLGMPFLDIKNSNTSFDFETVKNLSAGLESIYGTFSDKDKENFVNSIFESVRNKSFYEFNGETGLDKLQKNMGRIAQIILGGNDDILKKDEEINPLELMIFETAAINELYKMSGKRPYLKSEIAKVGNAFYNTVEYCLTSLQPGEMTNENVAESENGNE